MMERQDVINNLRELRETVRYWIAGVPKKRCTLPTKDALIKRYTALEEAINMSLRAFGDDPE